MIRVWRLVAPKYSDRIFSGAGAYRHGGRWNSPGRAVVYMSERLSLCALESLVHRVQMPMMRGFKCVSMDVPQELITEFGLKDLPVDWTAVPVPQSTQRIGDRWFDEKALPVLKVPSTVIPGEHNFVVNPSHPEFRSIIIGKIQDFKFDKRLLDGQ